MQKIEINDKTYIGELDGSDFKGIMREESTGAKISSGSAIYVHSTDSTLRGEFKSYLAKKHTGDLLSMTINPDKIITINFTNDERLEFDRLKDDFKRLILKAQKDMEANYFLKSV